jgi:hypothetical protein
MCVSGHTLLLRFVAQALSLRQVCPDTAFWPVLVQNLDLPSPEHQVDARGVGVTPAALLPKVPMKTPNQAFIGAGMASPTEAVVAMCEA